MILCTGCSIEATESLTDLQESLTDVQTKFANALLSVDETIGGVKTALEETQKASTDLKEVLAPVEEAIEPLLPPGVKIPGWGLVALLTFIGGKRTWDAGGKNLTEFANGLKEGIKRV